jgi:hypothetical protein
MKPLRAVFLCLLAVSLASQAQPLPIADSKAEASAASVAPGSRRKLVTLREIGMDKGVIFDGAQRKHQMVLHFPVLDDLKARNLQLRLRYRASSLHDKLASMRVDIAGIPQLTQVLPNDGADHELVVPVNPALVKGNSLRVSLLASLLVNEDRCVDERIGHAFLHIQPGSGLEADYDATVNSLRDAWQALPAQVTVSLAADKLDAKAFAAAWGVVDMLYREAHSVRFVRLPELGDVVVAPAAAINAATKADKPLTPDTNLSLLNHAGKAIIAVTDPFDVTPMYLLMGRWRPLAAADGYRILPVVHPRLADAGSRMELPLAELGLNTEVRNLASEASWWSVLVGPQQLPPGTRLDSLRLEVLAPPRKENESPFEFYAYMNGTLLKAARLDGEGGRQIINVPLPREQQQLFNHLSISMQYKDLHGDCHGLPYGYPVQILPTSTATLKQDDATPVRFADLPRYLAGQTDIYLPNNFLDQPESALSLLGRISAVYPSQFDLSHVQFVAADAAIKPERRFLAVGNLNLAGLDMPVRFDRGRIDVVDARKQTLLSANDLPNLTVAQIVNQGNHFGLWVRPDSRGQAGEMGEFFLSEDDVAFVDQNGVRLTMNSRHPTLVNVRYLDYTSWVEFLDQHRFWLFGLGWFALTVLAIYLYRKSTQHRKAAENI